MRKKSMISGRSGIQIMTGLIRLVRPLLKWMYLAIFMGCIGNLMATFLTVIGGYILLEAVGLYPDRHRIWFVAAIILFALLRGVLRYTEQACNHYIAFKLLAEIRHKVFAALRNLAPAKLDGKEKGNLISIITSDIELLEVFYAHTISPIAIAVITSVVMIIYQGNKHPALAVVSALFYLLVGFVIPWFNGRAGASRGIKYRNTFGALNTAVLDNLYGMDEILQYQQKENRLKKLIEQDHQMESIRKTLKKMESRQQILTDTLILSGGIFMTLFCGFLVQIGSISVASGVTALIAMMSSFGPTAALSALSNNLQHTLASGGRVLDLLEETPLVNEISSDGVPFENETIQCKEISFGYDGHSVFSKFNERFEKGKIHGIWGKSGCGKSTLLKLFMRFYETKEGTIFYGETPVNSIETKALRDHISYVTQETFLFHDTIENNIKIAKEDATREEVICAAKKASIHDFIQSLPEGYDTQLSELGDSVSGGERQRIGIARAFLHQSPVIFLDEPTSNIDSLNEGIILTALKRESGDKTIILVSHRKSTMGIADSVIHM